MITLELNADEAGFLLEQLAQRRHYMEHELIHTDKRSFHAAVARDLERLDALYERIRRAVTMRTSDATV
jgi:hypothetical protein